MASCDELAARLSLDRSEVVRRTLNVVATYPELISRRVATIQQRLEQAPRSELVSGQVARLEQRLEQADGLWRYWTMHDITENDDDWAAFSDAVREHLAGKPVDIRFIVTG